AGWRVPLENRDEWVRKIRYCLEMGQDEYARMSAAAREFAETWLDRSDTEAATDELLRSAISGQGSSAAHSVLPVGNYPQC
ncbi:MAG: glycosyltransferase, partial [Pyrinomonadaceae bacterium]